MSVGMHLFPSKVQQHLIG